MNTIFISGATGYIGAHLTKRLADAGNIVHALCRSKEKAANLTHQNVKIFWGDILNAESVRKAMKGCTQAFHLAAYAKVWAKDTGVFYNMNVIGTSNVLEAAYEYKIKKIVVTSTAGVYGPSLHAKINEDKVRDVDFFNEYEGSKALSESRIKDFIIHRGMDIVVVSPTRVYGPYLFGEPESITKMIRLFSEGKWRIMPGDGTKRGNYVYIEDVVDGHVKAMKNGRSGHTYLLGNAENHDYLEFFESIREITGVQTKMFNIPISIQIAFAKAELFRAKYFGKNPVITPKWMAKAKYHWEVDVHKSIEELEVISTSLEDGMNKTISWLKIYQTA